MRVLIDSHNADMIDMINRDPYTITMDTTIKITSKKLHMVLIIYYLISSHCVPLSILSTSLFKSGFSYIYTDTLCSYA